MALRRVLALDDLWDDEMLPIEVDGRRVLVVRLDGVVRAYEDRCAHKGVALSAGTLAGGVLTCSAHQWQFDARTGRGINPASCALVSFSVQVRGTDIWIDVGSRDGRI